MSYHYQRKLCDVLNEELGFTLKSVVELRRSHKTGRCIGYTDESLEVEALITLEFLKHKSSIHWAFADIVGTWTKDDFISSGKSAVIFYDTISQTLKIQTIHENGRLQTYKSFEFNTPVLSRAYKSSMYFRNAVDILASLVQTELSLKREIDFYTFDFEKSTFTYDDIDL